MAFKIRGEGLHTAHYLRTGKIWLDPAYASHKLNSTLIENEIKCFLKSKSVNPINKISHKGKTT